MPKSQPPKFNNCHYSLNRIEYIQDLQPTVSLIIITQQTMQTNGIREIIHTSNSNRSKDDARDSSPQTNNKKRSRRKAAPQMVVNLSDTRYSIVRKVVKELLGFRLSKDPAFTDWDLQWTDNAVAPETLARMRPFQKINHFPGMFNLSRKNYLARHLVRMSQQFSQQYDFYPKTWVLPTEYNELRQFMQAQPGSTVIAKPQASCQGKGIFLSKQIQDFSISQHYVVQKYLRRPLLLDGLKFDLRIYVLVAGCDPLRVYIYREGLARFATQPYCPPNKQNLSNLYMHLTNYAINKANSKFQFNASSVNMSTGHKRSLTSILQKLKEMGHDSELVWSKICDIVVKTLLPVQPVLAHHYRSCQPDNFANNMCFEVLGFDVILDADLKPIILEVNYTPSFTTDTPLDTYIKQNLIKDTLILLNINNKVKNDTLNAKKRQMLERTLTGKKTWFSKEQRDQIIEKQKHKRDNWENTHLGNFVKIYPPAHQHQQIKYLSFLNYAQKCYLSLTGGNIKRNVKISLVSQGSSDDQSNKAQTIKYTNTDQLQKIYIKKSKPMIVAKRQNKNYYLSTGSQKDSNKDQPIREWPQALAQKGEKGSIQKINCLKFEGVGQIDKIEREGRAVSSIKSRGLSKIYNVTFKEMRVRH